MNNIIIASGHLGSTVKAAKILAENLQGADIFDTAKKPDFDFSKYNNFIFGANIRMFSINKRFKKWAKKLKKYYAGKKAFIYLVGVDIDNKQKYIDKVKKILPVACDIKFFWGELNPDGAKGFIKAVITGIIEGSKDKETPHLLQSEIEALASVITAK